MKKPVNFSHFEKIALFMIVISIKVSAQNELDVLLDMNMTDLMNIEVITASKTLQRVKEVPATVRIITLKEIKDRGYTTLDEALSDLPGFNFRNINGFNSYVFQRGIPNQNNLTLLLIDGIQINELNSGGFYSGTQFDMDDIKQIEVVYGPASSLYGTNAVQGIINIITKSSKDEQGLYANIQYGSFNTLNSNVRYGYNDSENDFGFKISGAYKTTEKADLGGSEGDNNWSENMENFEDDYSLNTKAYYKNYSFGAIYQNKQSSRTTSYKTIGTNYIDRGSLWNISFFNAFLKGNFHISSTLDLNSRIYFRDASVLDNTIGYITESDQVGYYRPNNLLGIENMLSYKPIEELHLIGGIVYENENLSETFSRSYSGSKNVAPPAPETPPKLNNNLVSIYLQAQYDLISYLNITAGARYDNSSFYGEVLTPRIGLIYKNGNFNSKFLYTEAFRAPKPWDYTSGIGNSELKPEEMQSFEINASYIFNDNFMINATLYKNNLEKLFYQENFVNSWRWTNKGWVKIFGAEIETNYSQGPIKFYINYTYTNPSDNNDEKIYEICNHSANSGITYSFNKMFKLNLRANYIGEKINPKIIASSGNNIINPALLFHTNLSVNNIHGFNFYIGIRNIFDTEYYHTSNRPPDRYRQPQRTILLKVEYNFF